MTKWYSNIEQPWTIKDRVAKRRKRNENRRTVAKRQSKLLLKGWVESER